MGLLAKLWRLPDSYIRYVVIEIFSYFIILCRLILITYKKILIKILILNSKILLKQIASTNLTELIDFKIFYGFDLRPCEFVDCVTAVNKLLWQRRMQV